MNWNILYNKTNDIKEIMRNILKIKDIKKEQVKDYIN